MIIVKQERARNRICPRSAFGTSNFIHPGRSANGPPHRCDTQRVWSRVERTQQPVALYHRGHVGSNHDARGEAAQEATKDASQHKTIDFCRSSGQRTCQQVGGCGRWRCCTSASDSHTWECSTTQYAFDFFQKRHVLVFLYTLRGMPCINVCCPESTVQGSRFDEARNVNTSLSALARVIAALANGDAHIPYRDSTLTQVTYKSDCIVFLFEVVVFIYF